MSNIRVYEYGLRRPTTNEDLVLTQIRNGHRYRNKLIEVERDRRTKAHEILNSHGDSAPIAAELTAITQARDTLREQIGRQRATTRSRSESAELRAQTKLLGKQASELRVRLKAIKEVIRLDPEIKAALDANEKHAQQRVRDERAKCECYWGTYLLAEQAADAARKSKTDPKFQPFKGEGRVSVQISHGISPTKLLEHTQVQIHHAPSNRGGRRADQYRVLRLRVSSDAKKRPIWAEFPMVLHRPLPDGALIKVVTVSRRRLDCKLWAWRVQLTIDMTGVAAQPAIAARESACAINLGWRQTNNGLRVAYIVGTDGDQHQVTLPKSIMQRVEQAEAIRSLRDKNLDELRPLLCAKLAELNPKPEWFTTRIEHMHAWRSAARFASLAFAWRKQRFDGDEEAYALLERWRYRDEHLQCYEAGLVRGALADRRETYRVMASKLAARYHTLVIDDTDYSELQRSPEPESVDVEFPAAKRNQRHAAPYQLRLALVGAFQRNGKVVKQPAADQTITCHLCTTKWSPRSLDLTHTCECGATWDQDYNNCINLLKGFERRGTPDPSVAARSSNEPEAKKSRSQRLHHARKLRGEAKTLDLSGTSMQDS